MSLSPSGLPDDRFLPRCAGVLLLSFLALVAPLTAQDLPSVAEFTEGMEAMEGFVPLYWDGEEGALHMEVARLDEPFLYMTSLATGLGSNDLFQDRGAIDGIWVARFVRTGPTVFLVLDNPDFRAETDPTPALIRSVEESFPTSTIGAFEVEAETGGRVVVDATAFFLRDAVDLAGALRDVGAYRLDDDRSRLHLPRTRAFPENTEVEATLTFTSDRPGFELRRHTPDARAVTVRQHHSLAMLPDDGYEPRPFDPRVGLFSGAAYFDFGKAFDQDYPTQLAMRHRLEKADPGAAMSPPVEPIVYYLDPAVPEPYRSAFKEGGGWWNEVFEAAGFVDAFRIEDMPEDMDPMDARYHVIQWVHRTEEGSSIGPSLVDPRTGEIIKAAVRMDSYRSLANYNQFAGALGVAGDPYDIAAPGTDAEAYTMARRRQHSAHEIGHTLGLAHNFIAVADGRASVMDYPAPKFEIVDGRLSVADAYRAGAGAYDTLAIRYAYEPVPAGMSESEFLNGLLVEAQAQGWRFITNPDAGADNAYPDATWWTNGADVPSELDRMLDVRAVMLEAFGERAIEPGEPMHKLWRRFAPVYFHHRASYEAAVKTIGGMEYRYGVRGDPEPVTRLLPAGEVERAMRVLARTLSPEALAIPEDVLELMAPRSFGWVDGATTWESPAEPAFDQIGAARTLVSEVVGGVLEPSRMARVVAFHARDDALPSAEEVVEWLVETTWDRPEDSRGELVRLGQRAVVDGLLDLAADPDATVEARAAAVWGLRNVADRAAMEPGGSSATAAHRTMVQDDVRRFLERGWADSERSTAQPGPGWSRGGGGG